MLPKLNDVPGYDDIIPSTGQKIKFRPYLVKEEKILLLAMESQDTKTALNAIADTVVSCIHEDIDRRTLTVFDIEYLFLRIRSKSVGERSNLNLKCSKCEAYNEFTLNLEDIKLDIPKTNFKIKLTDQISLMMKWPSYVDVASSPRVSQTTSATEQAFAVIINCIESIQTEEENILAKDVPEAELTEFIESMNTEQYRAVTEFMKSIPKLHHDVEFDCEACGHHNKIELDGITDFF